MAVFKRGDIYWYEFVFKGTRYQRSTGVRNQNVARNIESARRTELAKGIVGIQDRPTAPTLKEFEKRFTVAIETECGNKPETVSFYREKYRRLLEHAPLAGARLDAIDEALIDNYKQTRRRQRSRYGRPVSPASVNRELATLSRALRLAKKWKLIAAVPHMQRLPGERTREFVLDHATEGKYLATCPQPLRDAAVLMVDTGLRAGEARKLRWVDVHLRPAVNARRGFVSVAAGTSKSGKRRAVGLSTRAADMLQERRGVSESVYVFPGDSPAAPILGTSLDHQHDKVRTKLKLPSEFVLHSLRHTMLSRLGEAGADAFTIMKIAGHSSVVISQRYVHPSAEAAGLALDRLDALNVSKHAQTSEVPTIFTTDSAEMPLKKTRKSFS